MVELNELPDNLHLPSNSMADPDTTTPTVENSFEGFNYPYTGMVELKEILNTKV